jgi:hypothetical protein
VWGDSDYGGSGAPYDKDEAILVYPISEGAPVPETPHALIDPSALIAAKPL